MSEEMQPQPERKTAVTVLAVLIVLLALFKVYLFTGLQFIFKLFNFVINGPAIVYLVMAVVSFALLVAVIVGLFQNRKWGFWLFVILMLIELAFVFILPIYIILFLIQLPLFIYALVIRKHLV